MNGIFLTSDPFILWFCLVVGLLLLAGILVFTILRYRKVSKAPKPTQTVDQDTDKLDYVLNVSHEMRTPLTLISGPLSRLISTTAEDSPDGKTLRGVYKQSLRLKSLVNAILAAEENVDTPNGRASVVPFNKWLSSLVDEFLEEASAQKVAVITDMDPDIKVAEFDERKCRVIVGTLVMNAVNRSPERGKILIKTELAKDSGMLRVSVSDRGVAVKEADLADSVNAGLGAGLPYSMKLAAMFGGSISVYNNPKGGATFCLEFPYKQSSAPVSIADDTPAIPIVSVPVELNPVQEEPEEPELPVELPSQEPEQPEKFEDSVPETVAAPVEDLKSASILIVEDDMELRHYLKQELAPSVKEVFEAFNGVEALKCIEANPQLSVIVSDVMMPEMDGFELCKKVKTTVSISHIPIILLTARIDEMSRQLGYKNGADDYMTKPFDFDKLLDSITNLFHKRQGARELFAQEGILPSANDVTFSSADEMFMKKLQAIVTENISDPEFDTKVLIDSMGMSRTVLFNKVKELTGLNLQNYVNKMRMERVITLLKTTSLPLSEVAEKCGFNSPRYFSTSFKNYTGKTPSQYKKENIS